MRTKLKHLIVAAVVAGFVASANAALIFYNDQEIPIPTTYNGVTINLETGATSTALGGDPGADVNLVFAGLGITNDADQTAGSPTWQPVRAGTGNTDALLNLSLGTVVGPTSTTSTGFGGSTDNFTNFTPGERGVIGFSVVLEDNTVAYGWMEVTLQNDNVTPGVVHAWAFDTSGAAVTIVPIPEPTHILLITLGILGSALRRRR